jgi:hypothetical protein
VACSGFLPIQLLDSSGEFAPLNHKIKQGVPNVHIGRPLRDPIAL